MGIKHKLYLGTSNATETETSDTNPLPVKISDGTDSADVIAVDGYNGIVSISPGHVSTDNSTSTPLGAGGMFTGTWEDVTNFGVIVITTKSDQASATNGLMVEFSSDGVNVDSDDDYTIPAATGKTFSFQAAAKYYRVKYTNSGTPQTYFRLQTILKPYYVKPSSHRIADSIISDDDAELVKSVNTALSELTGAFENINSFRGALKIDQAWVHRLGISEHFKRDFGAATTLDVAASAGDTVINVVDTTGFVVGDSVRIYNTTFVERSHFHIVAVSAGVSLTLSRPIDNDLSIGDHVQEIQISMNQSGTLASPISFKIQPPSNERWQITRFLTTMLDQSPMDDALFGGITALTNGVVIRIVNNGSIRTYTHWQTNGDLFDDMYDVSYSAKAPAGFYGLSGRWTLTNAQFVADLEGSTGDYLEVLIQDDLTALDDFQIKAQGRVFAG